MSKKFLLFPVALVVIAIDQITKEMALSNLPGEQCESGSQDCIDLFAGIRFRLLFNEGAAFSAGQNAGQVIGVLGFVIIGVLIYFARQRTSFRAQLILGVLAGGAAGNLVDRLFRANGEGILKGAVVDFIDFGWWPVFNIADTAIVLGAIAAVFFLGPADDDEEAIVEGDESPDTSEA